MAPSATPQGRTQGPGEDREELIPISDLIQGTLDILLNHRTHTISTTATMAQSIYMAHASGNADAVGHTNNGWLYFADDAIVGLDWSPLRHQPRSLTVQDRRELASHGETTLDRLIARTPSQATYTRLALRLLRECAYRYANVDAFDPLLTGLIENLNGVTSRAQVLSAVLQELQRLDTDDLVQVRDRATAVADLLRAVEDAVKSLRRDTPHPQPSQEPSSTAARPGSAPGEDPSGARSRTTDTDGPSSDPDGTH